MVILKSDFLEIYEIWLLSVTVPTDEILNQYKNIFPNDAYSGMLNVPFLVTRVSFGTVKELIYNMVHT